MACCPPRSLFQGVCETRIAAMLGGPLHSPPPLGVLD
jgi:hypothetical protein